MVNPIVFIEDGEQVYPCRCGETHRGGHALYDWGHHNCFHDEPLIIIGDGIPMQLICPQCGQSFTAESEVDA